MVVRKLERESWEGYFDRASRGLGGRQAEVAVEGLDLGDQIKAEWLPLLGLTYDPKDDSFEIALEGLDHLVPHPREIHVDETPTGLASVEVRDAEGHAQIVRLRSPLVLPA